MDKKRIVLLSLTLLGLFSIGLLDVKAEASASIISHSSYVDSIGHYHIVGEVENTGSIPLIYVKVIATFYDVDGHVVGTDFTYAYLRIIPPGEKSPFHLIFTEETQIPKIDHYALNVGFQQTQDTKPLQLVIKSHSSYTSGTGTLHIVGEVENQGEYTKYVQVIATGYDEAGRVVAAEFTYTDPSSIAQGQTAPFNLMILQDRAGLVRSYVIVAESDKYRSTVVPEFHTPILVLATLAGAMLLLKNRRLS